MQSGPVKAKQISERQGRGRMKEWWLYILLAIVTLGIVSFTPYLSMSEQHNLKETDFDPWHSIA